MPNKTTRVVLKTIDGNPNTDVSSGATSMPYVAQDATFRAQSLIGRAQSLSGRRRMELRTIAGIVIVAGAIALGGCSTKLSKHGHQFRATDLQRLQPGMSKEEVRFALGTPTTTSTVNSGATYYYISSTRKQTAFLTPKETDRKVVAIYFNPLGTVDRIADYGMKDGRVFDFISRKTPSASNSSDGILKALFRNLGHRGSLFGQ